MRLLLRTLWRLLFPAWGFFDVVGVIPVLEWRAMAPKGTLGPWRPVITAPRWRWWHAVWHPAGTRALALQTIVERATFACLNGEDAAESLALVEALVTQVAAHADPHAETRGGSWRLVAQDAAGAQVVHEQRYLRDPA